MPQIKYSGLVTDIKGKAGGSVFASNKQGSYFRNNKWGGGRKSTRWNNAKNRLSQLSSQWKALNAEQQAAWNAMTVNYPFYNKFKVEYTPSGYQLFMSLNGNLLAAGFPLLTIPVAPRSYPEDLIVNPSQPDVPWVTIGTGATFPNISGGTTTCYSTQTACPVCYTCNNGLCVPITPENPQAVDSCLVLASETVQQVEPNSCSTDQDCYDQGLGTGNDIECQNGECIYVGDGFMNWNAYGYILNVSPILFNDGSWNEHTDISNCHVVSSFRYTFGPNAVKKLTTTTQDVVIVSNYQPDGRGLGIRARQIEQGFVRFFFTLGVDCALNESGRGMLVWYQDVPTSAIATNTVIQFQVNPAKTQGNKIAIGNSGWLPAQFGYYADWKDGQSINWGDFDGTNNNPWAAWTIDTSYWGVVYGAGMNNLMTDNIIGDIRWWTGTYRDYLEPLIGYLTGTEAILILANGDAKPKCNYAPGCNDLEGVCKPASTCTCKHNICGLWGQRETFFPNKAPDGNTDIILWPAVPILQLNTPGNYDDGYSFSGTWMNLDGGYFGNLGATYVPNVVLDITAPSVSGFALTLLASRPKVIGSTFYDQELVQLTTLSLSENGTYNIWEFIKLAVANVPLGSEIAIGWVVIDTDTGYIPNKVPRVRFKAGAELSSSVN